ncbi:MAG: phosphotransferase [Proteobacteria bacterium]|nr:phosphotransferase [Pseudomonadota bacterium]MDA1070205.1 phosphotransferase [Pseudomonadota bacterium]
MTILPVDLERIASLLAAAGLGKTDSVEPLSGTGNRTFAARGKGFDVIVRLPGHETAALVDREAEAHNAALAATLGVAPALIHRDDADGAMVMVRAPGATLADLQSGTRQGAFARLGAGLARLHRGPAFLGRMDPWQKIAAYLDAAGLDDADAAAFGSLWPGIAALRARTGLDPARLAPCHVDPVPANAIDDGRRVLLVDWEYAAMSDPLWDLAYVCVEGELEPQEESALLAGYGESSLRGAALADWKLVARAVSAAWCMARAAFGDAPMWRLEVANRLAALAGNLDDAAAAGDGGERRP